MKNSNNIRNTPAYAAAIKKVSDILHSLEKDGYQYIGGCGDDTNRQFMLSQSEHPLRVIRLSADFTTGIVQQWRGNKLIKVV